MTDQEDRIIVCFRTNHPNRVISVDAYISSCCECKQPIYVSQSSVDSAGTEARCLCTDCFALKDKSDDVLQPPGDTQIAVIQEYFRNLGKDIPTKEQIEEVSRSLAARLNMMYSDDGND